MAVSGTIRLDVVAQAEENIRAVLRESNAAIRDTSRALEETKGSQEGLTNAFQDASNKLAGLKTSMSALGVLAAVEVAKQIGQLGVALFDLTQQGAKLADQFDAVQGRVADLPDVIERVQVATTGIVDEESIVNAVAAFDAFGLSIDLLPGLMEQASKASLRTGEDVDFLIDSAVKGVARLSPAILDNLGLQVTLADATKVAAESMGVQASAVDDAAKKAGMLSLVLRELGKQNADIDLNRSRVASIKRAEVSYKNLTDTLTKGLADLFISTGEAHSKFAAASARALRKTDEDWAKLTANIKSRAAQIAGALKKVEGLNLTKIRELALEQEETAKRTLLQEKQLARATHERAALNTKLAAVQFRNTKTGRMQISNQVEYNRLVNEFADAIKEKNDKENAALEKSIKARRAEEAAKSKADRIAIQQSLEMTRLAMGESAIKIEREKIQKRLNKAVADGDSKAVDALGQRLTKLKEIKTTRSGIGSMSRNDTAELREQLRLQKDLNDVLFAGSAQDKAGFDMAKKRAAIVKDTASIKDAELRRELQKERFTALLIERDNEALRIEEETATAAAEALKTAEREHELMFAMTEEDRIRVDLRQSLEDINKEALSTEEKTLMVFMARADAERQLDEERRERFATQAEGVSDILGGAFGEMSGIMGDLDSQLDSLNRPKRFEGIMKGFAGIAAQSDQIASATAEFMTSFGKGQQEVAKGATAALGAVGPAVAGFVSGTTEKALVMSAFELAMGVASMFVNPAESASHFTAAGMFAAMAGVSATMPTTELPEATAAAGGGLITPAAEPTEMEAQRVTVNLGPGMIMGLPQDLGRAISEQINSMSGTGMEATAF